MAEINITDKLSILNYGIGTQHRLASLNEVVSDIVKEKDYSDIQNLYDTMIELMSLEDGGSQVYADALINGIREELLRIRVELLKEGKLYSELRNTNELYLSQLVAEIKDAEAFLSDKSNKKKGISDTMSLNQLRARVLEMRTSRTVGEALSNQLSLYEKNSASLADKISSVTNTLMPLWESGVALSINKASTQKAFKMLKALVNDSVKKM
ncbi:MAG: toxic anion resistance protein [Lachnospiraceae bacterium]|nr:toxic anion resistance protein [Lachnospiraceae bacterium]